MWMPQDLTNDQYQALNITVDKDGGSITIIMFMTIYFIEAILIKNTKRDL